MVAPIAKKSAVDNLEAILNLRGIDVAQFAPVDFSMDAGRPVQGDDLEVTAARNRVVRTSVKM